MSSRLFSLVALPLSFVGHLLFWTGSVVLLRNWQQFGALDIGGLVLVLAGIVLIAAAIATVAFGWLGAVILGVLHVVFSLLVHLLPFDFRTGAFAPAFDLMNGLRSVSMEISDGMFYYFPPGAGLVTGMVLLGAGLAARSRAAASAVPSTISPRVPVALAGVVGLLGLLLAIAGGAGVYIRQLVTLSSAEPLDVLMLYIGALLVGAVAYSTRWSSAGVLMTGAGAVLVALIGFAAPAALVLPTRGWLLLSRGLEIALPSGLLLLIGVLLLASGLAARWRRQRAASITH